MKIIVLLPTHPIDGPQLLFRSLNSLLRRGLELWCYSPCPCYYKSISNLLCGFKVAIHSTLPSSSDYALAIAFDIGTIQHLYNHPTLNKVPRLLISSSTMFCTGRPPFVDAWLRDSSEQTGPPYLSLASWSYQVHLGSFPWVYKRETPKSKEKLRLLVSGNKELVYKLAPWLNSLVGIDITVLWNGGVEPLFNQHIQLCSFDLERIEDEILSSDIVIGSGLAIELALLAQRPAIVVGQRGFGGLITDLNLIKQHASGYTGRIGGLPNEYVPIQLVAYAYEQALQMVQKQSDLPNKLYTIMQSIQDKQSEELQEQIEKIVYDIALRREKVETQRLQLSPSYKLLGFSEDCYTLTHLPSGRVYGQLGAEEASIIKLFNEEKKVSDALMESAYSTEPMEFLSFVQHLVSEYILIPQS